MIHVHLSFQIPLILAQIAFCAHFIKQIPNYLCFTSRSSDQKTESQTSWQNQVRIEANNYHQYCWPLFGVPFQVLAAPCQIQLPVYDLRKQQMITVTERDTHTDRFSIHWLISQMPHSQSWSAQRPEAWNSTGSSTWVARGQVLRPYVLLLQAHD